MVYLDDMDFQFIVANIHNNPIVSNPQSEVRRTNQPFNISVWPDSAPFYCGNYSFL